ncbi:unnamed protein product [Lampetra planeri]
MYRASALSLYRAWESFNEARSADDAEEREARLDKFLALLHHYRWKGNLCLFELEKICPAMNAGACNVLARELLTDIHQLCRNLERRQEQQRRRESGHVTALADYLLAGRGFTLLLTLDSLLNQELACREDLLNLLLSLLPLLWKIPVREEQARAYHLPPLGENLFSASSSQAFSQPQPSPSRKGTAFPLSGRYNCSGGSASRKHRRHRKGGPGHEARDKAQAPHASTDSELSSSERPTAAATLLANWRQVAPNRSLASTGLFTSEDFSPPKPGGSYPSPLGESLERFGCGGAAMEEQAARLADVEAHVQPSIETEVQRLPVCELDVVNANDPSGLVLGLGRDAHVADGTPFELCRVLLSLLGKLCEAELASATRGQASVCTVLPSLLRFLSALGGGDRNSETGVMAAGWTGETVAFVQRMLLHAVLRLLTATNAALHGEADGMPDALRTAALDLLNAARLAKLGLERPRAEPFAPRLKRTLKEVQQQEEEEKLALYKCLEPQDESKSRYHWLLLLPELIHATLQLMLRYVQAAGSNPFLLNQAVDLIQEFVKQQGFDLLQESLVDLEALVSSVATQQQQRQHHLLLPSPSLPMGALEVRDARVYIRILVDDITEVISALKKARVEQVYPASGHRKRHHHQPFHHRACPQPSCPQEHHHSDLSGLPMCAFTPSRMPLNPFEEQDDEGREDAASLGATGKTTDGLCCVAIFSARCLAMLESVQTSEFALRVLSGTSGAGVCCCLDLHAALRPILRSLWSPVGAGSKAYQQYALAVLGKLLLDQLGGNHQGNVDGKPKPSTACQICESAADDDGSGLDSAAQSGGSSPSSAQAVDRPRRWEALAAYRGPVLGEAGPGAALLVARHLCHLARRGGPELRRQLYVHVLSPAIRQGVEATQHARQLGLGGEAAAGGCVHACHLHARCPSPQLIRKCLEAVPVLLQHRSLLELFLVSDGLSQVTELLFLEEVRPAALAVFHTLILALEGQGPEEAEGPEPVQRSSEASQRDAANSAHLAPDSPQRLSRLCAGLRDGHVTPMRRKKSHGDGSPEFHHNNHHHHQHHHHNQHHHQQRAADLFLCVTLLSVTRDEGGEDSTDRDSEDTSGYDSTPCVCVGERYGASSLPRLSPDCAALPTSDGEVRLAADVWASCRRLCQASLAFRGRLARSGALQVCRRLTAIIIKDLSPSPGAPRQDGLAGRRPKAAPAAEDNDAGASAALPRTQSNTSSDFSSTEQLTTEVHVAAAALSESSETITQQEPADGDQTLRAESCDGSLQRPPDDDGDDADAPDAEVTPTSEAGDGPELVKIRLLEALLAVCLHGCTLTGSQQRDNDLPGQGFSTKDLLKELWGLLAESGLLATELARPLCEALLRVALTGGPPDDALLDFDDKKRADEELFPLDGEWSADPFDDPEEVKGMQPEHSPGGGCSGEEGGYEADSESNPDDNTEEGSKDESAPRLAPGPAFPLGMDGGPAACASPQPLPGQLAYPELCVLVLKLLAAAPLELSVATRVFRTLLEIARGGEQNRVALYQQGVVKTLLIGFTALLGQADPAMRECQTALVDLLVAMTTSHMSSEELALLLRLFSEQRPPTELLLSGLSQVVQANTQAVPSHFLSFPTAQGGGAALHAMARVATAGVKARAASPVQRAFQEFLRCTRPDPSRKDDGGGGGAAPPRGPASPWVISSVRLALPAEHQAWGQQHTGRPAGFSASLWLRVGWGPGGEDNGAAAAGGAGERVRRSKKNRLLVFRDSSIDSPEGERVVVIDYPNPHKAGDRMVDEGLLHLLSFGSRSLMLQVWAEPDAGLLTFRVVVDAGDGKKVDLLAQAETAEDVLALGQWQHLALSYQQRPEGKRNAHGRLAVWIDGCRVSEMALDFVVPPARKPTSPADAQRLHCLLGHSVGSQEEAERLLGSWSLGNLMVFYDAILTPEFAFHLFACGPDTRSILPCKQRSPAPVYSKYVTLAMLEGGNLKDLLACSSEFNLSPLVMNLCLTYCPSHPTRYTVYDFPAPTQSRVPGRAPPPAKAPSPRDIKLVPDGPEVLRAPQPSSHRGLQSSVYKIGGTSAFIFLFARVVELSESEVTQAKALEVALSLARRHQKRVQEMSDCHGYAMIYEVLTKKRCLVGFHTLKVLLEACCDGVVLRWSRERSRFELERESDAVIQDVELLASLLLAWNVWMRAPAGVWETLLTALEILIRPNHPAQMFNIQQLLRARVVDQLLLTCQVLQENRSEGSASLPLAVSHSFVKIIGEVLGSPPDAALLASVCRFLLAVHPPDATYVCHASVGFYFTLRANGRALDERISAISALRRDQAQSSTPIMSPATAPSTTFPFHPATVPPASRVTGLDNCATGRSSAGRECHSEILKRKCGVGRRVADTESSLSPSSSSSSNVSEHVRGSLATADAFAAAQQRSRHEHQPVGEAAVPAPDARMFRRSNTNEFSAEGTVDESSGGPSEQEGMGEQTVSDGGRVPRLQRMMSRHWDLGLAFPGSGAGLGSSKGVWKSSTSLGEWDTVSGATTASGSTLSLGSPMQHCSVPEDGLMLVCCGLYHLLQGVLLNLPDSMLPLVTEQLLTAETLLVLANHRSPLQRLAVVKLLDVYFQRVSDDQKAAFVKMHGLYLLANQLHQRAATHGLAEALLSMLLACPSALDEELELQAVRECPSFQRRWGVPLLALAESSLHDTPLAHNLLCALLQLFGACTRLADVLLDSGLLSTLCNIVALLTGIAEGGLAQWECRLLLGDVQQLLVAATIHACSTGGGQYLRLLDDLVVLLNCLQGSANPRTQGVAVALQFRVLQAAVDLVRSVADTESQGMTSSFVLPSAPHHALQQKRRSIAGAGASMAPHSDTLLLMRMRSVASDELSRLVQRRMSQDNSLRAPEAELIQRLQRVTVMAVNRILFQDPVHDEVEFADLPMTPSAGQPPSIHCGSPLSDEEDRAEWPMAVSTRLAFQRQIFHMMLDGLKIAVECGKSNAPRQQWRRILWACRETFRAQLGRLLVHVLSPLRSPAERRLGLEVVAEPNCKEMLRETLSSPPQARHGPKLALYVSELLREQGREGRTLGRKEQRAAEVLLNLLRQCGYKSVPPGAPPKADVVEAVREEREKFQKEEESNREAWVRRMTTNGQALLGRIETRARSVSRVAAEVTQRVAGRQGLERKKVIAHIREAYKAELSAQRCWQTLFRQLTHERAVWFDPVACPSSWQLDPTEGPNRERRRLQRCHITIPNKYLLKDRWTSAADAIKLPLSFLFDDKSSSSGSSAVKDKATSEPTKFTRRCISVVPSRETPGELLLGETGMYFVEDSTGDATETPSCVGEAEALSFSWTYEDIKEVHLRWWQLRDNALEVFLTNGRTLLLTFDSTKVRDQVYQTILSSDLPNLLEYGNLSALTQLWCAGQITNFEYLTHLNKHAGRSFNDLMQYPVFPFVLRDYASETLDLADPKVYRNLVKPIAVQCKEKEDRYINNYKWLEEEYRKGGREDDPMPPVQPYHYGSHYSNSGTVLHFLVRLPPFTKMFLAYQGKYQSFDIPDRTFHSMVTTWRLSSYESTTDVKELVPEFFYLPEFLANREGFDFGLRQNGDRVNHVTLPLWARGDPRLFVLLQRQALESENVSLSLCHWIDLVFGHKQKGKAAVQAINVFHPATYFGMDVSAVEDPVQRRALETMIKTYGQTPRQLFSSQHPTRGAPRSPVEADITSAMGMLVQLAFRETRETRDHARETVAPSPLPWIKGLRWGEYVGSPSCPDPMVCFSQPHPGQRFGSLLALPTRVVCGLAPNFCLMMTYSKEQGVRSMHNTDIHWSAILSWGYADNILRLKSKQTEPPVSFIQCDAADQVSSCAWVPDGCQLFTGNQEGVVTAYVTRFSAATPSELEVESCVHLYGHTDAVALLHVCKPYSVLVSASIDGTCIVWDLNRLCYVQSLTGHKSPVMAVSASETTGDIATACSSVGGGSDLRLWTVNGDLIGHVHSPEMVRSLAFSNQPEGTSVNVIAGGLETGVVRLWSTWDLKPVREIAYPKSGLAVISLTFSCDGLHLFTVDSEGKVVAWCRRDHARSKPPLFYSFLGSFSA